VQDDLRRRYSPEQIAGRLRRQFPDRPEMWVSAETIYQSVCVQSRGALKRELTRCLRTGRALRRACRQATQRRSRVLPDMINIAQRPPEADNRRVPGHWEGDLIGKANRIAVGTLVERSNGYAMLIALPDGYKPERVAPTLAAKIQTLPQSLRRSLTRDQGTEMRDWKHIRLDAGIDVYLCDPHAPGNAPATRTPTGCSDSTSPRADFSAITEPSWMPSPTDSKTGPASASSSPSPPSSSPSYCCAHRSNPPFAIWASRWPDDFPQRRPVLRTTHSR
jgi:transposase, IS30 family